MSYISYVASCLTDPWVIGPLAVVALIFGWTCIPYDDQKRDQPREAGRRTGRVSLPHGSNRVPPADPVGEAWVIAVGNLSHTVDEHEPRKPLEFKR